MSIIIGLVLLGLVLISFEVIVPGGVLGVFGGVAIIAACVMAFQDYGALVATAVFCSSVILVVVTLVIEFKYLPKTKIGQQMFLKTRVEAHSTETLGSEGIEGKEGKALTVLAPTGKILVEGKEYEGFSQDGLIKQGETVRVIARDNFRVLVKK